jgi:DNA-binding response OmpR family regulator
MKKRVLVVENNKEILELISIVLNDAGYEPTLYINEQGIFEHIVELNPDAILLDIVRPTIEGTELCRQIKEAENTKHIPVIVLSTHTQIGKVKEICADEVVEKPFDIEELLAVLNEHLSAA